MRKLSLKDGTEHRIARAQHTQLATHKLWLRPWERGTQVVSEPGDQRSQVPGTLPPHTCICWRSWKMDRVSSSPLLVYALLTMPQLPFLGQTSQARLLNPAKAGLSECSRQSHHQDHPSISVHTRLSQGKHRENSLHTDLRPARQDMRLSTLSYAAETVQGRGGGRGSQRYPAYHLSTYFLLQTPVQTGLGFGNDQTLLTTCQSSQL